MLRAANMMNFKAGFVHSNFGDYRVMHEMSNPKDCPCAFFLRFYKVLAADQYILRAPTPRKKHAVNRHAEERVARLYLCRKFFRRKVARQ